jgi:single-strand DNA-binding protein
MAGSINQVAVSGNLTRDPELRHTPNGMAVCELGVANTRSRKDGEEWVEEVSYFDVTVWGGRGEMCAKKLTKGAQVFVSGYLQQDRWETPEGNRSKVKIVARMVEGPAFFEKGDVRGDTGQQAIEENQAADAPKPSQDDDIPF